jgi:hypothetical protein
MRSATGVLTCFEKLDAIGFSTSYRFYTNHSPNPLRVPLDTCLETKFDGIARAIVPTNGDRRNMRDTLRHQSLLLDTGSKLRDGLIFRDFPTRCLSSTQQKDFPYG